MKHTPGPWHRDTENDDPRDIVNQDGELLAVAYGGGNNAKAIANACLIAAAPDLLESLKLALKLLQACPPPIRHIIEAGNDAIEAAGINPYCINEGLATGEEKIDFWWISGVIDEAEGR